MAGWNPARPGWLCPAGDTGLGLQLVVLPFAFRQLGPERFGVYGVFVGIISLFTLLDAGMVYSLLMQLALVALSVLAMATSALWPLLASHKANDKNEDAIKVLRWCNASALICSIGVGISLFVSLSTNAASWFLGFEVPWLLQLVFASYLVGSFWEHTQLLPFYAAGNWRWPLTLYMAAMAVLVSVILCLPQCITLHNVFLALLGLSLITTILLKLGTNRSVHFGATGV